MKARFTLVVLACVCALLPMQSGAASRRDSAREQGEIITYKGEPYIRVYNARQFIHAIISGGNILVAKDTEIDLSPVLDDAEWWASNGPYYKWLPQYTCEDLAAQNIVSEEVFDGRQLTITGYRRIVIAGECNSSIIVHPRYAFCLNFVNCQDITIRNLTIGHTHGGYCEGGVIGVTGGRAITIDDCDLYGCGTYGVQLDKTSDFTMIDSNIRDCTYGIMTLNDVQSATFDRCNFFRNKEFSLVESRGSNVAFNNCRFYANNPGSPLFYFDREFDLNNCYILHPTEALGTIELARQSGNSFCEDLNNVDFIPDGMGVK